MREFLGIQNVMLFNQDIKLKYAENFFSIENKFAECNSQKHSANNNPMPSVFWKNTR